MHIRRRGGPVPERSRPGSRRAVGSRGGKAAADPLDLHKAKVYGRRGGDTLIRKEMRRILQDAALTVKEKAKDGRTIVRAMVPENFTEVAADALWPSDGVSEITFTGKVIHLLGIAFTSTGHTVQDWKEEVLACRLADVLEGCATVQHTGSERWNGH